MFLRKLNILTLFFKGYLIISSLLFAEMSKWGYNKFQIYRILHEESIYEILCNLLVQNDLSFLNPILKANSVQFLQSSSHHLSNIKKKKR